MYNPPVLGNVNGMLGAINMGNAVGGTNWPGVAYDPETAHDLRPRQQRRHHVGVARHAAAELLGHPLRVWASPAGRSRKCSDRATAARPIRRARRRRPRAAAAAASRGARSGAPAVGGGRRRRPAPSTACRSSSRRTERSRRSISIAARSSGRCRTATRRTTSAIIRR